MHLSDVDPFDDAAVDVLARLVDRARAHDDPDAFRLTVEGARNDARYGGDLHPARHTLLIDDADRPVGHLWMHLPHLDDLHLVEAGIAVDPDHRRRGHGTVLRARSRCSSTRSARREPRGQYLLTGKVRSMTSAREALLTAAGRLFYESGVTATGVDTVVRGAGVTKPTLYAHFASKADLLTAVLERRHAERRAELEAWLAPLPGAEHPLAVLDWLQHFYADRGERGCGFLNAAAELPDPSSAARAVVRAEKAWLLGLLVDGCAAAGCGEPQRVGSQLLLLLDGVAGRAVVGGPDAARDACVDAREAAVVLLGACA